VVPFPLFEQATAADANSSKPRFRKCVIKILFSFCVKQQTAQKGAALYLQFKRL
jgi:hypothetical protein